MRKWFVIMLTGFLVAGSGTFTQAQEDEAAVTEDEIMEECVKMLQEDEGLSKEEATSECEEMLQDDEEAADEEADEGAETSGY